MKTLYVLIALVCLPVLSLSQNINKAKKMFDEKDYKGAKTELEKILELNEDNHEAHFYLGKTLYYLRQFDDASDEFEEAVDLNEKSAEYHYWLGMSYAADATHSSVFTQVILAPKIKNQFLKTLELDNKHLQARINLANYYLRAPGIMGGSIDKAYEQANILIKQDEKNGRLLLSQLYEKDEKPKQAEEEYKILEKKYGNLKEFYDFYNSYGYFLIRMNRSEEAVDKFKKQVELAPDNANTYDSLGDGYLALGRKDDALAQFKKALEIDPSFEASKKKYDDLMNDKGQK